MNSSSVVSSSDTSISSQESRVGPADYTPRAAESTDPQRRSLEGGISRNSLSTENMREIPSSTTLSRRDAHLIASAVWDDRLAAGLLINLNSMPMSLREVTSYLSSCPAISRSHLDSDDAASATSTQNQADNEWQLAKNAAYPVLRQRHLDKQAARLIPIPFLNEQYLQINEAFIDPVDDKKIFTIQGLHRGMSFGFAVIQQDQVQRRAISQVAVPFQNIAVFARTIETMFAHAEQGRATNYQYPSMQEHFWFDCSPQDGLLVQSNQPAVSGYTHLTSSFSLSRDEYPAVCQKLRDIVAVPTR